MFPIKAPEHLHNCVYDVIRPLYIIARLFGFFPFSVEIESKGKSKIFFTLIDYTILAVNLTICGCFAYLNIMYDYMENAKSSPLLTLGTRFLLVYGIINGIVCVMADVYNRHRIFQIFHMCHSFDVQMQQLGSALNYKRDKRSLYIYLMVWTLICLTYYAISFWVFMQQYTMDALSVIFASYFITNNIFAVALTIYAFFVANVRARYRLLNENLSHLSLNTMSSIKLVKYSMEDAINNLMKIADLHNMLNDILENINRCYSIQAMLSVAMSFSFMVFCLFSLYRALIMRDIDEHQQCYVAMVQGLWSTFYNFFVFSVVWAGHSTKNEGKFTAVLLHRIINKCRNSVVIERLMTFSQQLSHRIPDASCNLFSFDFTLLFSIVAATATYLIILIQFDASGYQPAPHGTKHQ